MLKLIFKELIQPRVALPVIIGGLILGLCFMFVPSVLLNVLIFVGVIGAYIAVQGGLLLWDAVQRQDQAAEEVAVEPEVVIPETVQTRRQIVAQLKRRLPTRADKEALQFLKTVEDLNEAVWQLEAQEALPEDRIAKLRIGYDELFEHAIEKAEAYISLAEEVGELEAGMPAAAGPNDAGIVGPADDEQLSKARKAMGARCDVLERSLAPMERFRFTAGSILSAVAGGQHARAEEARGNLIDHLAGCLQVVGYDSDRFDIAYEEVVDDLIPAPSKLRFRVAPRQTAPGKGERYALKLSLRAS